MTEQIYNIVQRLPANITGAILTIIITGVILFVSKILAPKLKLSREEITKKKNADKELLYKQKEIAIHQLHTMMTNTLNRCYRQGFRNDFDRMEFMGMYSDYRHIGGNTDGDVIYHDFLKIPYRTTLEVPQRLGVKYPSEETNNVMHRFYQGVMQGYIDESEVKPYKTIPDNSGN